MDFANIALNQGKISSHGGRFSVTIHVVNGICE